jgi:hypothetical protein
LYQAVQINRKRKNLQRSKLAVSLFFIPLTAKKAYQTGGNYVFYTTYRQEGIANWLQVFAVQ